MHQSLHEKSEVHLFNFYAKVMKLGACENKVIMFKKMPNCYCLFLPINCVEIIVFKSAFRNWIFVILTR